MTAQQYDDPRKLRSLVDRASELARAHAVRSVLVGLAAREGDLRFPEFIDFLRSALRVEDGVFRMTRERAVLHLADVDEKGAREVLDRLLQDFEQEYPSLERPCIDMQLLDVTPEAVDAVSVKSVLTTIFSAEGRRSLH